MAPTSASTKCRGVDQRCRRAGGHPRFRPGGARAARKEICQDRFLGSGGLVTMALTHQRAERSTIGIRKGDQVRVIAGRDAGKSGRVLSVNARKNTVVVEHIAIMKRHTRPNPGKNIKGGIVEKEAGINVSNVMVVCPDCGKHSRIGHNILPDGTKVRTCKRCNATLDK